MLYYLALWDPALIPLAIPSLPFQSGLDSNRILDSWDPWDSFAPSKEGGSWATSEQVC